MKDYTIGVTGALDGLGREILQVLAELPEQPRKIIALDKTAQPGQQISYGEDHELDVVNTDKADWNAIDLLFLAGSSRDSAVVSKAYKNGNESGKIVDAVGLFAMDPDVPLVVSGVNHEALTDVKKQIISVPHSSAVFLALALSELHKNTTIKRVVTTVIESVSHHGKAAMDELFAQTKAMFLNTEIRSTHLPKKISFNVHPLSSEDREDCHSVHEWRTMTETKKVLGTSIRLAVSCVQAPVFVGDMMTVAVETEKEVSAIQAASMIASNEAVGVIDDIDETMPTPADIVGDDMIYVCRLRDDPTVDNGIQLTIIGDNQRRGGALNAVLAARKWLRT